ncbi:MAG: hypothetical protein ACLP50_08545, partial [Solirubrobacteraceae bacterium]
MADASLRAGAVAAAARAGAPFPGGRYLHLVGEVASSAVLVGVTLNPPSTITSRSLISRLVSSAAVSGSSVSSAGLPIWLTGGRMNPRAPGLVLAV